MRSSFPRLMPAITACAAFFSVSCGEDLGTCDEEAARTPVLVGNQIMYAGQAIMVRTCASGCHASGAQRAGRLGAPAGLDFDIGPIASTDRLEYDGDAILRVEVDRNALLGLRRRQGIVFEEREKIWAQVRKDLMPPEGVGGQFRDVEIADYFTFSIDGTCPETGAVLPPIATSDARDVLRNWLACGAPIVETQSDELPVEFVMAEGQADQQVRTFEGTYGTQYPACRQDENAPPFDAMYDGFIAASCVAGCHSPAPSAYPALDLSTPQAAYAALMGPNGEGEVTHSCTAMNPNPLVTPNDPTASYLIAKLGGDNAGPLCNTPMPVGSDMNLGARPDQLMFVLDWINAGAPGPNEPAQ